MMSNAAESLRRQVHLAARHLDDGDYTSFLNLFTDQGEYRVEAQAPELAQPMTWMHMARDELGERCAQLSRQQWQIADYHQTRLLSLDIADIEGDQAHTSTGFVIYQTDQQGRSECYAVGRYEDEWRTESGHWKLDSRCVQLKTRLLSPMSPLPL
jgi:3-phenylpropionate/cinnamic acid dioxygenase small subunit